MASSLPLNIDVHHHYLPDAYRQGLSLGLLPLMNHLTMHKQHSLPQEAIPQAGPHRSGPCLPLSP